MLASQDRNNKVNRINGIITAKKNGKYGGRKPIAVDTILLQQISYQFKNKTISEKDAMKKLGLVSRSTFYRKIKQ